MMCQFIAFTKRNIKIFFRDKGLFLVSLITPLILLVLYITFLGGIYKDTFINSFQSDVTLSEEMINGFAAGQLVSSLLAVVPITVAFSANFIWPSDKNFGIIEDFYIAPTNKSALLFSYFFATFICDFIICFFTLFLGLIYIAIVGWYLSVADVFAAIGCMLLLCLFGSSLSSLVNIFLNSKGAMSAVGTLVSSCYGFLVGAYMPLSQFAAGMRNILMFLPGTYGTGIQRNVFMRGIMGELVTSGVPLQAVEGVKDAIDCNLYIVGAEIPYYAFYLILAGAIAVFSVLTVIFIRSKKIGGLRKRKQRTK